MNKLNRNSLRIILILLCVVTIGYTLSGYEMGSYERAVMSLREDEEIDLPIIMYHSVLNDRAHEGKYVISPEQFKGDIEYLKQMGYEMVNMTDVIAYVHENKPLPEKPIMITFDDGYYNNYLYVFPIIKETNTKIVISPVTSFTEKYTNNDSGNAYYSHITWDEARELAESPLVEFQNHSDSMHSFKKGKRIGSQKMNSESVDEYQKSLYDDLKKAHDLLKEKVGVIPNAFTYPFGDVSKESRKVLDDLGYKASMTCYEGMNKISKDKECLYLLRRYNRDSGKSSEDFFQKIIVTTSK